MGFFTLFCCSRWHSHSNTGPKRIPEWLLQSQRISLCGFSGICWPSVQIYECELWISRNTRISWYIFIYKAILGLLPSYLLTYISVNNIGTYNLRSQDFFLLSVTKVRTELGKNAFKYSAPSTWNKLQKSMKLNKLVSLVTFKRILTDLEAATSGCRCFAWCVKDCGWL